MPSITGFKLIINIPPELGEVSILPLYGEALETLFTIKANNYKDVQTPLSY